jgi:hypothetical protein
VSRRTVLICTDVRLIFQWIRNSASSLARTATSQLSPGGKRSSRGGLVCPDLAHGCSKVQTHLCYGGGPAEDLRLIAILGPAADITVVFRGTTARPHRDLSAVLRCPRLDLGADLTDYLVWRGLIVARDTAHLIRRIVELSTALRSIGAPARGMYTSRRALARRLLNQVHPVPSHWLRNIAASCRKCHEVSRVGR